MSEALLAMITSAWVPQAIHAAAQLGIADALAGGGRTSGDIAAAVGADADALRRLLRALCALGLVAERDDAAFELTALGGYLRADADPSLRSYALLWGGSMWPIWGTLLHTVKTGKSPRALVTRKESFESLAQNTGAMRVFNDAMSEISRLMAAGVVRAHDFSRIRRLVDVGGGHGELLGAILAANPGVRGVLADLPHVLEGARLRLESAGVADRLELAPGSFFDAVPSGGDAYLLKSVLHDWNDERAGAILTNVRRAMDGHGALLVVERVVPERLTDSVEDRFMAASDLGMMVAVAGRERTAAELGALFRSAGFSLTRITPAAAHYSVIEGACA